jgi:hypothetical protein
MKRPIGAGFRFWRFRRRSAVLRRSAVGSGQSGRWPIRSPLTQNGVVSEIRVDEKVDAGELFSLTAAADVLSTSAEGR